MKMAMLPKACSMQSPIKIPIPFIREIKKINPIIHLSAEKAVNRQSNTKYIEQRLKYHNILLLTILQRNSNKNNMVLLQKQI
jgi:hypothetical protein